MRGKRSKQYRKLMQQFSLHFGFREPYQVLLDAEILEVAARSKMNFISMLSNTLHGEIKPMITQCCMRHLYNATPKNEDLILHAKNFERRRCNHQDLEQPLSAFECIKSVIDPNENRTNKHRYVVACQDQGLQELLQTIPGVPIIYILRSVMIMKPMSDATARVTAREERTKLQSGIRKSNLLNGPSLKRKAGPIEDAQNGDIPVDVVTGETGAEPPKKKNRKGPKAPNPLSIMKPKKEATESKDAPKTSGSTRRKR